eukprot:scaffold624701_cov35-Prasinocladus_malaysianus.AAC.1
MQCDETKGDGGHRGKPRVASIPARHRGVYVQPHQVSQYICTYAGYVGHLEPLVLGRLARVATACFLLGLVARASLILGVRRGLRLGLRRLGLLGQQLDVEVDVRGERVGDGHLDVLDLVDLRLAV